MKQAQFSRHHLFIVILIVVIIILGVGSYIVQRNAIIKTIAGEAIRQRISSIGVETSPALPDSNKPKEKESEQFPPQGAAPPQNKDAIVITQGTDTYKSKQEAGKQPPGNVPLPPDPVIYCPQQLTPATSWTLAGWKVLPWKAVDVQCLGKRVLCYYADDSTDIARADQIIYYQDFEGIEKCVPIKNPDNYSCACKNSQK